MTRVEELRQKIVELRESGAEQEDIAQVVQELNMELVKERTVSPQAIKGGVKPIVIALWAEFNGLGSKRRDATILLGIII